MITIPLWLFIVMLILLIPILLAITIIGVVYIIDSIIEKVSKHRKEKTMYEYKNCPDEIEPIIIERNKK